MAKLTEKEVRDLLIEMNPLRLGVDANPIVEKKNQFIITGIRKQVPGKDGVVDVYVQLTKLSDKAKKANPGLVAGKYIRMTKTDMVKEILSASDDLRAGRKPIAENLFENQNPLLFSKIVKLLMEKDEKGNLTYFTKMPDDKNGNPVIMLKNPVPGAFITLNVPAHHKMSVTGEILAGSRKNIRTGEFEAPQEIVFHDITFFLLPEEFDRVESIALNKFQKEIEPMLAEEIVKSVRVANKEIKREVKKNTDTSADMETPSTDNIKDDDGNEIETDEFGNIITK